MVPHFKLNLRNHELYEFFSECMHNSRYLLISINISTKSCALSCFGGFTNKYSKILRDPLKQWPKFALSIKAPFTSNLEISQWLTNKFAKESQYQGWGE